MADKFTFLIRKQTTETMFYDLKSLPNVKIFTQEHNIKGKILKFFYKVHNSRKINKILPLPFRGVWNKFSLINTNSLDEDGYHYIVFLNSTVVKYPIKYLKKLSANKKIKLILICLDSSKDRILGVNDYIEKINFDSIYTFDKTDSEKYGYHLILNYYSKSPIIKNTEETELFFIGRDKGRLTTLLNIYDKAEKNNVKTNFMIFSNNNQKNRIGVKYLKTKINYEKTLEFVLASNCILEVVSEMQDGQTLRYFEAICYNKKLLTNNKNIVNMPYYDSRYMRVFSSAEDINYDWIKQKDEINYNYNNDFSPIKIIDMIIRDVRKNIGEDL